MSASLSFVLPFLRRRASWLLALLVGGVILIIPLPTGGQAPATPVIRLEASSFEYSPASVRVEPGDHVTLEIVATDVVHGLYIDGYDLSVTADPGQTARISFLADKPGVFRFRCSVTCGPLHPFMIGKLYVGPGTAWWRGLAVLLGAAATGLLLRRYTWPATT